MNNPFPNVRLQVCNKHNQPIKYYDKDGKNPQCESCLLQKGELISFEQISNQYQEKIINNNKENEFKLQQLYMLKDAIQRYKENIITSLNKSIQQITDQINSIQKQQQSMQQLDYIMNKYASIQEFTTYLNNNQKSNRQCRSQILMNILLDFKSNITKIDFLHTIISQKKQIYIQTQAPKQIQIQEVILEKQKKFQKMVPNIFFYFEYELIQQVERKEFICCFAFDKNNNLIVGMDTGYIKIFDFKNGNIGTEIHSLQIDTDIYVSCLYSMKITHSFVSGSYAGSIKIWSLDKFDKWQVYQVLNDHKKSVNCIILNSIEDLLISGSGDGKTNFWRKINNSWNLSQSVQFNNYNYLYDLSLNENEDKLIVCGYPDSITVMTIQSNQQWKIVQKIEVEDFGYRLSFTIQDQFIYQPKTLDYLEVYDYDQTKQQFYSKSKVKVQSVKSCSYLFPCQYIKKLNILTVKHGQFVNIFQLNENGEYQLIQSIEYQSVLFTGKLTDDGEYLITFEDISHLIQVRKLKYEEKFI